MDPRVAALATEGLEQNLRGPLAAVGGRTESGAGTLPGQSLRDRVGDLPGAQRSLEGIGRD
jgi:hypothetical protein